jgi:hypothetical protein
MSRLKYLNRQKVEKMIEQYSQKYIQDWNDWLSVKNNLPKYIPAKFSRILGKWQACRPNRMRGTKNEGFHDPPFLEDLIEQATIPLAAIHQVEMRSDNIFNREIKGALNQLWEIFKRLSYSGKARNGLAGIVGISKAVLLLTEGRIGPAFDSKVRENLNIREINDPISWIIELKKVAEDIEAFERKNNCLLTDAAPSVHSKEHFGRLYDMIFGPRAKK